MSNSIQYLSGLTEQEKIALKIAQGKLGSSFDILRSDGFIRYCKVLSGTEGQTTSGQPCPSVPALAKPLEPTSGHPCSR